MLFDFARFATDIGPEGLQLYFRSIRGEPAPGSGYDGPARRYGRYVARLIAAWPSGDRNDLIGDLQRIESMADPLGLDCLLQASPDRAALMLRFARLKSARRRALFCFVRQHAAFVEAEHRRSFSTLRFSAHFVDRFEANASRDLDSLECPLTFTDAVKSWAGTELGIEGCRIHPTILQPSYPDAQPEYQIGIALKGSAELFACWGRDEAEMVPLHLEKHAVVNFAPHSRRITVTGRILKRPQRKVLATLFDRLVLKSAGDLHPLAPCAFALQRFLSSQPLEPPPGTGLIVAGPTGIRLRSEHAANFADYGITLGDSVVRSLSHDLGTRTALAICAAASVYSVDLSLQQAPDLRFPKGRRIRARVTPQRIAIESKLDEDLYLVDRCLRHWDVTKPLRPIAEGESA